MGTPVRNRLAASTAARPVAIDLFAGAGGLSLGFEQAGFDVLAAVEYDAVHAATHLYNFPGTEVVCRDAAKLSVDALRQAAARSYATLNPGHVWDGSVDALIGGPPCQGFSTGGKRDPRDGRNEMILEFVRFAEELRPATLCLENVAGLFSPGFADIRESVFGRLRAAGYTLSGTDGVVSAIAFGVPQNRRRMIVLGSLDGEPGRPQPLDGPSLNVSDAFDGLPDPEKYEALLDVDHVRLDRDDQNLRASATGQYARALAGLDRADWDYSQERLWSPEVLTGSRRTRHSETTIARFAATLPGTAEPKSRLFRLPFDGPARTLRAGTGSERGAHTSPRPIHPRSNRVITVREAARLHGFPDWFRFHTTNWHGHRQIGNSVPPPLARAAGAQLLGVLGRVATARTTEIELGDVSLLTLSQSQAASVLAAVSTELPSQRWRTRGADSAA